MIDTLELQNRLGLKPHNGRDPLNRYITQRPNGTFQIQKKINNKFVHLGYAKTIEEARLKRDKALVEIAKMEQQ